MFSKAKSILDAIEETIADIIEQVHLMWEAIRADRERWVPGTGAGTPTRPGKPGTDWRPRPIERPTRD